MMHNRTGEVTPERRRTNPRRPQQEVEVEVVIDPTAKPVNRDDYYDAWANYALSRAATYRQLDAR